MAKFSKEQFLEFLYEKKLPQVYRDMDLSLRTKPFYRYLSALVDGGYASALVDEQNFLNMVDPMTCPEQFLPYFMESFGLKYYPIIAVEYQRKFLSNIGELLKRRGTHSAVAYLVKTLTGLNVRQKYLRGTYRDVQGRHLIVTLVAKSILDLQSMNYYIFIVERYIKDFIPYYIYPWLEASIDIQVVETYRYKSSAVSQSLCYNYVGR